MANRFLIALTDFEILRPESRSEQKVLKLQGVSYEIYVEFSQESESANQILIRHPDRKLWRFEVSKIAILVSHVKSMGLKKIMNCKNTIFRLNAANIM